MDCRRGGAIVAAATAILPVLSRNPCPFPVSVTPPPAAAYALFTLSYRRRCHFNSRGGISDDDARLGGGRLSGRPPPPPLSCISGVQRSRRWLIANNKQRRHEWLE